MADTFDINHKDNWKLVGYADAKEKRSGSVSYTAKVESFLVPIEKGTIVGVCNGPLRLGKFKIQAIGTVVKGLKRTTTLKVIKTYKDEYKVGDTISEDNLLIAIARSEVRDYLNSK